jgi:hypothetical protein
MERQHLAGHSPARSQRSVIVHGGGPQAREVSSEIVGKSALLIAKKMLW